MDAGMSCVRFSEMASVCATKFSSAKNSCQTWRSSLLHSLNPYCFNVGSKKAKLLSFIATEPGVRPRYSDSLIISGLWVCILPNGNLQYKLRTRANSSRVHRFRSLIIFFLIANRVSFIFKYSIFKNENKHLFFLYRDFFIAPHLIVFCALGERWGYMKVGRSESRIPNSYELGRNTLS